MKVVLTGKRKGRSETLCGVKFVDGVGVLSPEQISLRIFDKLLSRYYKVELLAKETEVKQEDEGSKSSGEKIASKKKVSKKKAKK